MDQIAREEYPPNHNRRRFKQGGSNDVGEKMSPLVFFSSREEVEIIDYL